MVEQVNKLKLLKKILKDESIESTLVFTRTKHAADRVVKELMKVELIQRPYMEINHRPQKRSLKILKKERQRVLVATDIAEELISTVSLTLLIITYQKMLKVMFTESVEPPGRKRRIVPSFCEATEVKTFKKTLKRQSN